MEEKRWKGGLRVHDGDEKNEEHRLGSIDYEPLTWAQVFFSKGVN